MLINSLHRGPAPAWWLLYNNHNDDDTDNDNDIDIDIDNDMDNDIDIDNDNDSDSDGDSDSDFFSGPVPLSFRRKTGVFRRGSLSRIFF